MPSKVRVYELARELGMSNKEILDLCASLGIGAKSHSSSIVDAQGDRLRRKAIREGLVRETAPEPEEEPAPKKKVVATKKRPPKRVAKKAPSEAGSETRAPEHGTMNAGPGRHRGGSKTGADVRTRRDLQRQRRRRSRRRRRHFAPPNRSSGPPR